MRSYTLWESKRRRTRWTLYIGAMGRTMPTRTHHLRIDRLNVDTNTLHTRAF